MRGDHGQNAGVVVRVAVDVVVAVAEYGAAGREDSRTIPRDHRMRDPENCILAREKSGTRERSGNAVAGNDIAQHDGGGRVAGRRDRLDAETGVVGSHAIDNGDIERCPGRHRAIHEDSDAIIVRYDFAEHAGDDRRSGGRDQDSFIGRIIVGSDRIGHREAARCAGRDNNTEGEIPDDAGRKYRPNSSSGRAAPKAVSRVPPIGG